MEVDQMMQDLTWPGDGMRDLSVEERRKLRDARRIGEMRYMGGRLNVAPGPNVWVYFAYSANRIKIGKSDNIRNRLRGLRGHSALPITMLLATPGSLELEAEYHAMFAADRLHGEWFKLSFALRHFLYSNLDRAGHQLLHKAERDFKTWLAEQHSTL